MAESPRHINFCKNSEHIMLIPLLYILGNIFFGIWLKFIWKNMQKKALTISIMELKCG